MTFVYAYPTLIPGVLLRRYKRFFADIELEDGAVATAHCPNTGPMTGVCETGAPVYLSASDNPKRKLAYTWEMIQVQNAWVGINTGLPNRVVKQMLLNQALPPLAGQYTDVQSEVPYGADGKSRVDFVLRGAQAPEIYLEVKNTTLRGDSQALFPDTVTERGQKHLRELTALLPQRRAMMLYFINRGDCETFGPGDAYDPRYGRLLRAALKLGVEILPCRFEVSPQGISYLGLAALEV